MPPAAGFSWGSHGPAVLAYEARMKALHFDPGPVDGVFDQDTEYAVVGVEKYVGLPRDGSIGPKVQAALEHFRYHAAESNAEGDRVEIDLDRQVLTVYKNFQPILITTASTGSGERFCGGVDGCQYAITPAGHFHFYDFHRGWQKGKLGTMWNPYYFNGSIAVHGLQSVPPYPASHGCTRIPMHIADYFYTLVFHGESVYVVGTPMKVGNGYVGPTTTLPTTSTTTTPPVKKATRKTTTTHPKVTTTTVHKKVTTTT
jgi:peptidoglycan hydrolase-like protein with peptidoglycan-binding domain